MKHTLVRDWMTAHPITIDRTTTLLEAHQLMQAHHIRRLPIVDHGQLVGILTLGDVREARPSEASSLSILELNYLLTKLPVEKIMTRDPFTILATATIHEAAQMMLRYRIAGLPVVENEQLVGIITESDIFRVLIQESEFS